MGPVPPPWTHSLPIGRHHPTRTEEQACPCGMPLELLCSWAQREGTVLFTPPRSSRQQSLDSAPRASTTKRGKPGQGWHTGAKLISQHWDVTAAGVALSGDDVLGICNERELDFDDHLDTIAVTCVDRIKNFNMPRSPTSSEDEMAQSFSDYSVESESDSSKEETIYDTIRATAEKPSSRMEDSQSNTLVIRIIIPDLQQTKCIRFNPEASVWVAKQRILCTLNQSLKDVLNYGLFQPASNGRDGKFLDEERLLREYPQPVNKGVPSLEFRYKKRVYRQFNLDEKQLAKLHTKANLKKFMDHVHHLSVEKMTKMLDRGLDPNYHDLESGETPLTLAAQLDNTVEVIKALKNGGAHLDFRAKDGMTALHKAARAKNQVALKTLLELGASPNYKDSCGLTPLYHTAVVGGDPFCCELLLHEHATVSCKDENGWQEIHQACRYGHVQHLEHLLFYGADMCAQNASGNTALHICALYNQESCARVLLFRGANKEIKNYNSQSPFQQFEREHF
ncbi:hypothetical protein IHE44_0006609 [Lamprotornis superbus]|uniref:Talin N-terminal F0 domain-containing protein n=1 Tax=Lamprotornis superbus TaxID=245042 RepID=A0A835NKB0_9PASS|nr:hypothetical protein IHE44_0006609 [Lamprotornis superbus]